MQLFRAFDGLDQREPSRTRARGDDADGLGVKKYEVVQGTNSRNTGLRFLLNWFPIDETEIVDYASVSEAGFSLADLRVASRLDYDYLNYRARTVDDMQPTGI
jgi:hypothetical protein